MALPGNRLFQREVEYQVVTGDGLCCEELTLKANKTRSRGYPKTTRRKWWNTSDKSKLSSKVSHCFLFIHPHLSLSGLGMRGRKFLLYFSVCTEK